MKSRVEKIFFSRFWENRVGKFIKYTWIRIMVILDALDLDTVDLIESFYNARCTTEELIVNWSEDVQSKDFLTLRLTESDFDWLWLHSDWLWLTLTDSNLFSFTLIHSDWLGFILTDSNDFNWLWLTLTDSNWLWLTLWLILLTLIDFNWLRLTQIDFD